MTNYFLHSCFGEFYHKAVEILEKGDTIFIEHHLAPEDKKKITKITQPIEK